MTPRNEISNTYFISITNTCFDMTNFHCAVALWTSTSSANRRVFFVNNYLLKNIYSMKQEKKKEHFQRCLFKFVFLPVKTLTWILLYYHQCTKDSTFCATKTDPEPRSQNLFTCHFYKAQIKLYAVMLFLSNECKPWISELHIHIND